MVSPQETLKKRVEAILDMAVSTVSSLTESFMSGVHARDADFGLGYKNKSPTEDLSDKVAKEIPSGEDVAMDDGEELAEGRKPGAGEESDLTEPSDDESGMLEVHD